MEYTAKNVGLLESTSNQEMKRRKIDNIVATAAIPMIEKMEFDERQHAMRCSSNIVLLGETQTVGGITKIFIKMKIF